MPIRSPAPSAAPCRAHPARRGRPRPRRCWLWSPARSSNGRCGSSRTHAGDAHPAATAGHPRHAPCTSGCAATDWKQASSSAGCIAVGALLRPDGAWQRRPRPARCCRPSGRVRRGQSRERRPVLNARARRTTFRISAPVQPDRVGRQQGGHVVRGRLRRSSSTACRTAVARRTRSPSRGSPPRIRRRRAPRPMRRRTPASPPRAAASARRQMSRTSDASPSTSRAAANAISQ